MAAYLFQAVICASRPASSAADDIQLSETQLWKAGPSCRVGEVEVWGSADALLQDRNQTKPDVFWAHTTSCDRKQLSGLPASFSWTCVSARYEGEDLLTVIKKIELAK